MSISLIAAFIFIAVFLAIMAVVFLLTRRPEPVKDRLRRVREAPDPQTGEQLQASQAMMDRLFVIDPESFYGLRARLTHANYRGANSVFWYYASRAFLGIIGLPIGYSLAAMLMKTSPAPWIGAIVFAVFGSALPPLWVNNRVAQRREAIRAAVPNVLDLIIVCVEAGLSLNAAIQRIANDMKRTYPELSWELMILNQEIFIGKSRAEAFRNLARRTGVDELRSLATVLMQSDRMGTGIADVLRVQAQTLRAKRRQHALEAAHRMPVKLVFPLVLCIFPEMLVVLLSPGAIQLIRSLAESVE